MPHTIDEPFDHKLIVHKVGNPVPVIFMVTHKTAQVVYDSMSIPFSRRCLFHHKEGTAMLRFKEIQILGIENAHND